MSRGTINISTDLHGYTLPHGLRHFSLYFNALALFCYDLAGEVEARAYPVGPISSTYRAATQTLS